jgi:hypothetical protein
MAAASSPPFACSASTRLTSCTQTSGLGLRDTLLCRPDEHLLNGIDLRLQHLQPELRFKHPPSHPRYGDDDSQRHKPYKPPVAVHKKILPIRSRRISSANAANGEGVNPAALRSGRCPGSCPRARVLPPGLLCSKEALGRLATPGASHLGVRCEVLDRPRRHRLHRDRRLLSVPRSPYRDLVGAVGCIAGGVLLLMSAGLCVRLRRF